MSKRKANPAPGSPRKALGGSPLSTRDTIGRELKMRAEAECRDGSVSEGDYSGNQCLAAPKPWHEDIKFRSPADREQAVTAVQRMVSDIHHRTMRDHDEHERRMSVEYGTRIARLEADLREACQRDATHLIQRAMNGQTVHSGIEAAGLRGDSIG